MVRYSVSPPIITLTTDFGTTDAYAAILKGVILSRAPDVTIVDISHGVPPGNVMAAAYLLQSAYRYFPRDAIHLAVVDPGVGTTRRAIALRSPHAQFVGPDNGLFAGVLTEEHLADAKSGRLEAGVVAVELTERTYWLERVSQTFHGRDVFAAVTAHLALGRDVEDLGRRITHIEPLASQAPVIADGVVVGRIIYIDRFGNAISNIPADLLPTEPRIEVAGRTLRGLSPNYQAAPIVALTGSTGLIEIAASNASAADVLGLLVGDALVVKAGS
jgi:S-adenosylmethionine hydrolase